MTRFVIHTPLRIDSVAQLVEPQATQAQSVRGKISTDIIFKIL